jgi:hypothetical protein
LGFYGGKRDLWNVRWTIGTDFHIPIPEALNTKADLSLAFLGRHKLENESGDSGEIYDVAIGVKANPISGFNAFAAFVIPMNDEGFRADVIWRLGAEMTFF